MVNIEMHSVTEKEVVRALKRNASTDSDIVLPDDELRRIRQREEADTRKEQKKKLKLDAGAFDIPKDDEFKPNGDDAHFICAEKQTLGIADGVGGWSRHGIDAGVYARELMANCFKSTLLVQVDSLVDPMEVLAEGHSKSKAKGSSTACIITLQDNYLCAANLGDSGFAVIRDGRVFYKSPVLQHKFNYPFQLGNGIHFDSPRAAMILKVPVEAGDVIVAGTDGLFDNIFDQELQDIVKNQKESSTPEQIAWHIAEITLNNSLDKYSDSPFSIESNKAGKGHQGGKIDDITVIVAFIQPSDH